MKKLLFLLPLLMFFSPAQASGCDHPIFTYNDCGGGSPGPQGPQGIQGIQGEQGIPGATGATGPQGIRGGNGSNGVAGVDGRDGVDGVNGIDGINGTNGLNGVDGNDGLSLAAIAETEKRMKDSIKRQNAISLAFESIEIQLPQKDKHRVSLTAASNRGGTGTGIGYAYMFDSKHRTAVFAGLGHADGEDVSKLGLSFEF